MSWGQHGYPNQSSVESFKSNGNHNYRKSFEPQSRITCDACNQTFFSDEELKSHLAEHVTCGLEGCSFQAHYKIVLSHQNGQHFNMKSMASKLIKLETPEDIAKWRQERKKNFPTLKKAIEIESSKPKSERQSNNGNVVKGRCNRFASRDHPYKNSGSHNNKYGKLTKWSDRLSKTGVTDQDARTAANGQVKDCESVPQNIEKEEGEISDDECSVPKSASQCAPGINSSTDSTRENQSSIVSTGKPLVADYNCSEDEEGGKSNLHATAPALEKEESKCKSEKIDHVKGNDKGKQKAGSSKNNRKSRTVQNNRPKPTRRLTLFEKLMLNDVLRNESKIVHCIELLSKVEYKL
ncbi:Nuclear fragile X mental retardation-interacting protein 1 [Halotydeus destructor]|nr:Nuclear fragile X mental retardation-interacting protein 1 [Halotydeus destructor]